MEKISVWAVLFRMSTESSVMIRTPFDAKTFKNSPDDQLDAWRVVSLVGWVDRGFLPCLYVGRKAKRKELEKNYWKECTEKNDCQP